MRTLGRLAAVVLAATACCSLGACTATPRDNSATRLPVGQSPAGGPVGGAPITYGPECQDGSGTVACTRIVSLAGETVEILSAGQLVGNPTVQMIGDEVVYKAELIAPGPAIDDPDRLVAMLRPNGWRVESQAAKAVVATGGPGTAYEGYRIAARFEDRSGQSIATIELSGPAA